MRIGNIILILGIICFLGFLAVKGLQDINKPKVYSLDPKKHYPLKITIIDGNEWSGHSSEILCDSFQMSTPKNAILYIDGTKISISADNMLLPSGNGTIEPNY